MKDRPGGSRRSARVSDRYMRPRWEGFLSQDERGMLMIEGVAVDRIARKYGTPLYIYDHETMDAAVGLYNSALDRLYHGDSGITYAG